MLSENACHGGGLRVIHKQAKALHASAKFREEHAAFTFEVAFHPHIQRIHIRAHVEHGLEHFSGLRFVRSPVRIIVQVNHIEVTLAIFLFSLAHDAQEFFHPVLAIKNTGALLHHLMRTQERSVQNDGRIHRLHGACVFQEAGGVMPCRNRAGFFPFAIEFVTDFPLFDIVTLDLVGVAHPGGSFLCSTRACIHANHGLCIRERLDVLHEFFEVPLDVGPVGASLVAIASRHSVELVVVTAEQVGFATEKFHFANLHALGRQIGSLEADRHVAGAELRLVFRRRPTHLDDLLGFQLVFKSLVHTRIFSIVFGPVGYFKRFRTQSPPIDLQGINIDFFGEFNHNPRRIHRVQDFTPPHGFHIAVGQMAAANKSVVILGSAAVNRFAEESRSPACVAWNPKSGAVVFACTVPVVVIAQASVRKTENRVTAIDERGRHVVIAAGRVPNGKVGV